VPSASGSGAGPAAGACGSRFVTGSEGDTLDVAQRVTSSRFIGRRRELAELERSVSDDDGELPSLVFIAGESGVGRRGSFAS
jgi:hypothetical protein